MGQGPAAKQQQTRRLVTDAAQGDQNREDRQESGEGPEFQDQIDAMVEVGRSVASFHSGK